MPNPEELERQAREIAAAKGDGPLSKILADIPVTTYEEKIRGRYGLPGEGEFVPNPDATRAVSVVPPEAIDPARVPIVTYQQILPPRKAVVPGPSLEKSPPLRPGPERSDGDEEAAGGSVQEAILRSTKPWPEGDEAREAAAAIVDSLAGDAKAVLDAVGVELNATVGWAAAEAIERQRAHEEASGKPVHHLGGWGAHVLSQALGDDPPDGVRPPDGVTALPVHHLGGWTMKQILSRARGDDPLPAEPGAREKLLEALGVLKHGHVQVDHRPVAMVDLTATAAIDYTNHKGERAWRTIAPLDRPYLGSTPYHPEPGWLLEAWDADKRAIRTFALANVHAWAAKKPEPPADATTVRRYVRKAYAVEAVQFDGSRECAERLVAASGADGGDGSVALEMGDGTEHTDWTGRLLVADIVSLPDGRFKPFRQVVEPGSWIVKAGLFRRHVMTTDQFLAKHEPESPP